MPSVAGAGAGAAVGDRSAEFQSGTNGTYAKVTLAKNGTALYPTHNVLRTNFTTEYIATGGMFLHAAGGSPASASYAIQYAPETAATLRGRNARISWLKLGANDNYTSALAAQTTVSTTAVDAATLTFTPPTAGDYLVLASFALGNSASTQSGFVQLTDGTTSSAEPIMFGANGSHFTGLIPLVLTGISGSKTISLKYRSSAAGNTVTIQNVVLVAIRLDRFANNYKTFLSAANTGAETAYTATVTQTFTPAAAAHLSIATWQAYGSAASSASRTQVKYNDGVSDIGASDAALVSGTASRAIVGFTHTLADYSAASKTQTLYRASNGAVSVSLGASSGIITLSLAGLT